MRIRIRKGQNIPLAGEPEEIIDNGPSVHSVALVGADYIDLHAHLLVEEGVRVKLGQPLFTDRKNPGVNFTSPGSGIVISITRGEKRRLQSVVIQLEGNEEETFVAYKPSELHRLTRDQVAENLLESGIWTAFRGRPYSKVPVPGSNPHSIFVTTIDTNPLALRPDRVIREHFDDFNHGLEVIGKLTDGPVFICIAPGISIRSPSDPQYRITTFEGPHPAGLAGTHIHFLDPVNASKTVWHVGYQDVIAIGKLFTTGRLWVDRIVSLAGPQVRRPRPLRTRLGASTEELVEGELRKGSCRIVTGSALSGRRAGGPEAYLGRYHTQISVLSDEDYTRFLGWLAPGSDRYSITNAFISSLLRRRDRFRIDTHLNGAPRAIVPLGTFERVMPLDVLPTQLLRHLIVGDNETAQALGCLELDEEDLALCSFVCPSKYDYGQFLRAALTTIEKEG
jgi:Na+-transporting NADH:ubiquinone oxidoreductase subunit A